MIEIGKRYYLISHAYYHFVGTVVEITGPRRVVLKDVVQVHTCGRNWTKFFAEGFGKDTRLDVWPDGTELEYTLLAAPFPHPVPVKS